MHITAAPLHIQNKREVTNNDFISVLKSQCVSVSLEHIFGTRELLLHQHHRNHSVAEQQILYHTCGRFSSAIKSKLTDSQYG